MFAGPADKGVFSPSVQHTLHLTEKLVLDLVPQVIQISDLCQSVASPYSAYVDILQINYIEMILPNKHYVNVDLSKFPRVGAAHNDEVLQPLDKPSGNIRAALTRTLASKL